MEEMEHVVTEYHQFDNRDESTLIAIFGGFRLLGLRWNVFLRKWFNQKLFYKLKASNWSSDARCQIDSFEERSCRKTR